MQPMFESPMMSSSVIRTDPLRASSGYTKATRCAKDAPSPVALANAARYLQWSQVRRSSAFEHEMSISEINKGGRTCVGSDEKPTIANCRK